MNCSLCGRENRDTARFCDGCGGSLDATIVKPAGDPELDAIRAAFDERYLVESLLGRGGMGSVYKAKERTLERYVALKIIPQSRNSDTQFVERFRREARLAARLRHPRIVSIHEVGSLGGYHYFSMDFIEGGTLRSVVQRRHVLPSEDAISIVAEICRAVAHAHDKGIIHRDLKPENVMIDSEGDVFVMDFGLARAIEEPGITQTGSIMGSPFYMSPEQLAGEKLDERSDIYSLGLILYYCLTGEDLFAAESITGVIAKHATTRVGDVLHAHELAPPHLRDVLQSMLEDDRNNRARTIREILERLTLRKIVAIGMAATGQEAQNTPALGIGQFERVEQRPVASEDVAIATASARRKARLKSLLDEM